MYYLWSIDLLCSVFVFWRIFRVYSIVIQPDQCIELPWKHRTRIPSELLEYGIWSDVLQRRGPRIDKLLQYALYAFYVFYLPCIFLARERWKKIFLLTAVLVGMPPFSYAYSMVFVIIPLMLFLNENKGKPRDVFYAVCFVFCIAPIGYSPVSILGDATVPYAYSLNVLVMSLALMALTGFLALETWITRITEVLLPRRSK